MKKEEVISSLGTVLIKELALPRDKGMKLKGKEKGTCSCKDGGSCANQLSKLRSIRGQRGDVKK